MTTLNEPVNKMLYIRILGALIVIAVATVIVVPLLPADFQSVVGSTVGSIVGTALAFLGAVWLWTIEQRTLAADEAARELNAASVQRKTRDKELLRESLASVGSLIALNYHDKNLDESSINLQKRLIEMRLSQNTAMIHDPELREECKFINELTDVDSDLKYYMGSGTSRLYIARDWYLRLIALEDGNSVTETRPKDYAKLKSQMDDWYEYLDEAHQAQLEQIEEARREEAAATAAATTS